MAGARRLPAARDGRRLRSVIAGGETARPVRPNVGIAVRYRAAIIAMVRQMSDDTVETVRRAYAARPSAIQALAHDSVADQLDDIMRRLGERWRAQFDKFAPQAATGFADGVTGYATTGFREAMRASGFVVDATYSPAMREAYEAVIGENVGLIRSIPEQYLGEVRGLVMRSVMNGHQLSVLTKDLQDRYGVTYRRAALIARDQNAKATATLAKVQQLEAGMNEAVWEHSHGGRHPRPAHLAADGKRFDIAKGMKIEGEWIQPGEKINCRCVARPVLPGM